jgi:glycosyltransferase involved in cell wall biosynthesis
LKDGIQIFHGLSGEIPYGLKKKGIKTVVTVHDLIFMRYPQFYSFFDRNIHKAKARYAVKNADVVVAVSEQTKSDVIEFFGIDPSKIKVIYQGCHEMFKQIFSTTEKDEVRQKFNLPKNYILNVGTIEARKNILIGVKAIKDIDTHLVIVGSETSYFKEVKSYIYENNLSSKVTFLKGVTTQELAILYQAASLFIYPSLFEGFGIPIIEALFSGTPVISSEGGCFAEAGGSSSMYVNPQSPEALKAAINIVLNNEALSATMIENGYAYAQRFTPESIANSFADVYNDIIAIK